MSTETGVNRHDQDHLLFHVNISPVKAIQARSYIRSFLLLGVLQNLPQHVDRSIRLDSDTSEQTVVVDISDQCLGVGLLVGLLLGALGVAGKGGLVVEAVEVASGLLELLDPFLGLMSP